MTKKVGAETRLKNYFDRNPLKLDTVKVSDTTEDLATCNKCKRVIYCGAALLCNEDFCGLKYDYKK